MKRKLYKKAYIILSIICCLFMCVKQVVGQEIKAYPSYGDSVQYYDINSNGEILEINYARQTGKILGKVNYGTIEPVLMNNGWVLNSGQQALLFLLEPSNVRGWFGRVYTYSVDNPTLRKMNILIDLDGDFAFLPVSKDTSYVQYIDPETKKLIRYIVDVSKNAIKGTFEFDIRINSIYSVLDNGKSMLLAHPWGPNIIKIDIENNKILFNKDVTEIVSLSKNKEMFFIKAFKINHVLITKKMLSENKTKLYLIDLSKMQIIAESEEFPFFTGKYYLDEDNTNQLIVSCAEEKVVKSLVKPTGVIRRFTIQNNRIIPTESITFNPETEVALRDNYGVFKVLPKYSFDYLSMLTIQKKVFEEIPMSFTPEIVSEVKQSIKRIISEFNTKEKPLLRKLTIEYKK